MTAIAVESRLAVSLRILAATLGTLPVALYAGVCLARFLPFSLDVRFAVGFSAVVPLWIAAMCIAFLARRGARSWLLCLLGSGLMAAFAYGVPR
jgi:hypothetical protein